MLPLSHVCDSGSQVKSIKESAKPTLSLGKQKKPKKPATGEDFKVAVYSPQGVTVTTHDVVSPLPVSDDRSGDGRHSPTKV